jgi:hypothetical protein
VLANGYVERPGFGPLIVQLWKPDTRFWMDGLDARRFRITIEAGLFIRSDIILNVEIDTATARWVEARVRGWICAEQEKVLQRHAQA